MTAPLVIWDPRMLGYDLGGNHPLHPLRWELTWALAGELGVLDHYRVLVPDPADDEALSGIHTLDYIAAVREASEAFPGAVGHGLGTADNPVFPGMHDNAALIAGGSIDAARAIAHGEVDRAVNFCGGLHHAMPDYASGFCIYNDVALAITTLLDAGVQQGGDQAEHLADAVVVGHAVLDDSHRHALRAPGAALGGHRHVRQARRRGGRRPAQLQRGARAAPGAVAAHHRADRGRAGRRLARSEGPGEAEREADPALERALVLDRGR